MTLLSDELKWVPEHPTRLHNKRCAYCGVDLATTRSTHDHVIGARFVPKGSFHRQWNLLVGACYACNQEKAKLENDLSAVSMQPDAYGRFSEDDPILRDAARSKGWGARSTLTGKRVSDSNAKSSVSVPLQPGVAAKFSFVGPPQANDERVFRLCRMQIDGFFHYITYRPGVREGGYILEGFYPLLGHVRRSDWGNAAHRWFMDQTTAWQTRCVGSLASGYARVAIRRDPAAELWSWALEWNKTLRIVGFMGRKAALEPLLESAPKLGRERVQLGPKQWIAWRKESPLDPGLDVMFSVPEAPPPTT